MILDPHQLWALPCRGRPDIQWTNLDPEELLEELGPFASLEGFRELLDKAQVGQAYVGRPCLHPDDLHCPSSAPNHHSRQVGSSQVCQGKVIFLPFPLICSPVLGESRLLCALPPISWTLLPCPHCARHLEGSIPFQLC